MSYRFAFLLAALALSGCAAVHAPLAREQNGYPPDWPDIASLGPECKEINGSYHNQGILVNSAGETQSTQLAAILNLPASVQRISLEIFTRRLDQSGDAFSTLIATLDDNPFNRREFASCFCIRQTLACTRIDEASWSVPSLGLGTGQRNVYFSSTQDNSLLARIQDYHVDLIVGVPVFGKSEPWALFRKAD